MARRCHPPLADFKNAVLARSQARTHAAPLGCGAPEICEHCLGIGYSHADTRGVVPDVGLSEDFLDRAIVRQHRISPTSHIHAGARTADEHAHAAGKVRVAVRQHENLFDVLALGPLEHHEGVVDGQADHLVNAQLPEVIVVPLRASRREGTRQRK
jgi:hypothetical protein